MRNPPNSPPCERRRYISKDFNKKLHSGDSASIACEMAAPRVTRITTKLEAIALPDDWLISWIESKLTMLGIDKDDIKIHNGVKYAMRTCSQRENVTGNMDRRRSSSASVLASLHTPADASLLDSPRVKQSKTAGKQGEEKYSKTLQDKYHEQQNKLLDVHELEFRELYKHCNNGRKWCRQMDDDVELTSEQFCDAIDEHLTTYCKKIFFDGVQPPSISGTRRDIGWMKNTLEIIETICYERIQLQMIEANDLNTEIGWKIWKEHTNVIVSFMGALAVLSACCKC